MRALVAPLALAVAACAPIAGSQKSGVVAGDVSGILFVANKRGDSLMRIDLSDPARTTTVAACETPHELATSPDDRHVALACYGGTRLAIFVAENLALVKFVELGENAQPHGIVWHANGDLYATAEGRKSVFRVRNPLGSSEVFEYATGQDGSHMLAVSPDGNHAWTTDLGSKTVTLVDLKTRRAPRSVEVGIEPEGIALSPDGETLWVSARRSNTAIALDPMTLAVRSEVPTGPFPLRLLIRPQGDFAVTSNLADGSLSVIDTARAEVVRTIAVSSAADAERRLQVTILWSDDGERVYVAETGTDTIAEIDFASGKVLRRLPTGEGGDGLAIVP